MRTVVQITAIVFILASISCVFKPDAMRRLLEFFKQGRRIYIAGVIRFVLAIVFLLAAGECKKPWIIIIFGILFMVSGLLIFMLGPQRLKGWIEWWQKQALLLLRVPALVALAFGAVIVYAA